MDITLSNLDDTVMNDFAAMRGWDGVSDITDFCSAQVLRFINDLIVAKQANDAADQARQAVMDTGIPALSKQIEALTPVQITPAIL